MSEIPGRNTGFREVRALWRVLRRSEAEAIVVDKPRDLRLAVLATLLHRIPIVYRYNLNYRRPRNHLADRLYLARVTACIYQSRFIQDVALQHAPGLARAISFHIPNGYDTTRFVSCPEAGLKFRRRWEIPHDIPVVLTSAKLAKNKGHDTAIAALDQVRRNGQDVLYLVCGDGVRDAELRALSASHSLPTRFTGLLDSEEMIGALNAADLVLHPSTQEIFPNAVGEAMSCARAVVAADAGGTAELVGSDGSAGVLVPPNSSEAMAAAVGQLLANPARRAALGSAARERIQTEFPLKLMIDRYEASLWQVVNR